MFYDFSEFDVLRCRQWGDDSTKNMSFTVVFIDTFDATFSPMKNGNTSEFFYC